MSDAVVSRGAVILCGGRSSRMGRDKATLPCGPGEVMLGRVVRLVGQAVPPERIVCVAAPGQALPPLPPGVRTVRDQVPGCGPLAGLADGLAALDGQAEAVFATGCDAPRLVPALVERLLVLLADYQAAAPDDGRRLYPLAAVYRADVLLVAQSLLAAGERSLQALLKRCRTRRVAADQLRDVDPQLASLESLNTPEEYQTLLRSLGGR